MTTFTIVVGTLGVALVGILLCLGLVVFAKIVLPDDGPPPLQEGESIHSRLVKLPPPVHAPFDKGRW